MTPARKAALQWFYDRGSASTAFIGAMGAPSLRMFRLMQRDGQIEHTREGWALTDKGRRDLHEAGR